MRPATGQNQRVDDPDAQLAAAGAALLDGLDRHIPVWVEGRVVGLVVAWRGQADDGSRAAAAAAGSAVAATVMPALERLLAPDGAEPAASPLDVVRRSLGPATTALDELGVPPVVRDEFSETRFPDDVYDLSPASFADIHPDLHEPGLLWGAAKAHRHLVGRAASPPDGADAPPGPVVAFAPDLMDQSRLRAAGNVEIVRRLDDLRSTDPDPCLVIVDLDRPGVIDAIAHIEAPVVGFHPHEDEVLRDRAIEAGCRDVLTRAQFFRRLPELLAPA